MLLIISARAGCLLIYQYQCCTDILKIHRTSSGFLKSLSLPSAGCSGGKQVTLFTIDQNCGIEALRLEGDITSIKVGPFKSGLKIALLRFP